MVTEYWFAIFSILFAYPLYASIPLIAHCFYDTGFVWNRKKAILFIFITLGDTIVSMLDSSGMSVFVVWLAYFIICVYDYKGKKLVGFLRFAGIAFLVWFLMSGIFSAAITYFTPEYSPDAIETNPKAELILSIFMAVYNIPMFLVVYFKVYKPGIQIRCGKRETLFLLGYLFAIIVMIGMIAELGVGSRTALNMQGIFVAVMGVMPPILLFSIRISNHYHQRTKMQELYLQSELEHFRQYMHAQEETRRFRHDIRNNLLCMNEILAAGDNEKLGQYIKDMVEITDSLSFKYVTGDMLLDSILNSKAQDMEQQNIRFELDGVLAGGLSWKPMDICAVFANAIDNAIEACQKVAENRYISMNIKSTSQFWLISIENSVAEAVDIKKLFQKNGGYTSKSDSSRHGIGTYSMKQTVESYGAVLKADCTETAFTLEIMIDKTR